jgi:hypothetical protein
MIPRKRIYWRNLLGRFITKKEALASLRRRKAGHIGRGSKQKLLSTKISKVESKSGSKKKESKQFLKLSKGQKHGVGKITIKSANKGKKARKVITHGSILRAQKKKRSISKRQKRLSQKELTTQYLRSILLKKKKLRSVRLTTKFVRLDGIVKEVFLDKDYKTVIRYLKLYENEGGTVESIRLVIAGNLQSRALDADPDIWDVYFVYAFPADALKYVDGFLLRIRHER